MSKKKQEIANRMFQFFAPPFKMDSAKETKIKFKDKHYLLIGDLVGGGQSPQKSNTKTLNVLMLICIQMGL
jgi:hypothetical protein